MTRFMVQPDDFDRRVADLEREGKLGGNRSSPTAFSREGPWSKSNQLGNVRALTDLTTTFSNGSKGSTFSGTILKLDEWGFPEVWTVSCGLEIGEGVSFSSIRVDGSIAFGAGGATQRIDFDWNDGVQLALSMNAIDVSATILTGGLTIEEQSQVKLSVQISRGTRESHNPPVKTFVLSETVANGARSLTARLPNFASRIMLLPMPGADPPVAADVTNFYSDSILMVLSRIVPSTALFGPVIRLGDLNRNQQGMQVTASSKFLVVKNDSANPITYTAYAELSA